MAGAISGSRFPAAKADAVLDRLPVGLIFNGIHITQFVTTASGAIPVPGLPVAPKQVWRRMVVVHEPGACPQP